MRGIYTRDYNTFTLHHAKTAIIPVAKGRKTLSPIVQKGCNTVKIEEAIGYFEAHKRVLADINLQGLEAINMAVEALKESNRRLKNTMLDVEASNAVEIVRCKDCRHYTHHPLDKDLFGCYEHGDFCPTNHYGYCDKGVKRK